MLEQLSEKFAEKLIKSELISESNADVYVYGFFQTIMLLINTATILLIGFLFNQVFLCLILNIAYIPIRIFAGGYHAESPLKCYINSTIMIAVLNSIMKWILVPLWLSILLISIASVMIFLLAPVDNISNQMDEIERIVYRKRTLITLIIEIVIYCVFVFLNYKQIAFTITLGIASESVMLLFECIRKKCFIS